MFEEEKRRADEEKRAREVAEQRAEQEKQRAEQEKQRAEGAEQRAEEEMRARVEAERRADAMVTPVRDCIHGAPITRAKLVPAWGEQLLEGEAKKSTEASGRWAQMDGRDVEKWGDEAFAEHLDTAANVRVVHEGREMALLDLILAGRADGTLAQMLTGEALSRWSRASRGDPPSPIRIKSEVELEDGISKHVWHALSSVMGKQDPRRDLLPAGAYVDTTVSTGGESDPIVPIGQPYKEFYKFDRTMESWLLAGVKGKPQLPTYSDPEAKVAEAAEGPILASCMRGIVEMKPDALCPKKRDDRKSLSHPDNVAIGGHLVDYMQSAAFDSHFNPAAQVVTYGLLSRTRPIALCTGNHMTYGWAGVHRPVSNGETRPHGKFTKKFKWWDATEPPLECRPEWSHWEVLIRFILSGYGKWYLDAFPDDFKIYFKRINDDVDKNGGKKKRKGGGGGGASSAKGSSSGASGEPRDGSGGGGGGGGGGGDAGDGGGGDDDGDGEVEAAEAEAMETTSSGEHPMQRLYWEDLWDPLRFAVPATHPVEVELTTAKLPGDAQLLGRGRMGPTFRKTLQGRDVVVKTLPYVLEREELEGPVIALRDEMEREVEAYERLAELQGSRVPKLLWSGAIVEGMADALATEFAGVPVEEADLGGRAARVVEEDAVAALRELHVRGVLHGDVADRNVLWNEERECAVLIDLGFAKFDEEMSASEFEERAEEEVRRMRKEIRLTLEARAVPREEVVAGGASPPSRKDNFGSSARKRTFDEATVGNVSRGGSEPRLAAR
jgi:hypothetical protein